MHIHIFINILIFAVFICDGVSMACSKPLNFKNVLNITHQTVTTATSLYSCNAISAYVVCFFHYGAQKCITLLISTVNIMHSNGGP